MFNNMTVDKWGSGNIVISAPQPNLLWRLLGWKIKTEEVKVVRTDYNSYAILYRCNEQSWLRSFDEYALNIRNIANGQAVLNTIIQAGNNSTEVRELAAFPRVNQTNPLCSTVAF